MPECLLVGVRGGGGEEVYVQHLADNPPPRVRYGVVMDPHESIPGARALWAQEVLFNRTIHRALWPIPGLRAYEVDERWDLVHVHNHLSRIRAGRDVPVVMTVGGGSYQHYMEAYLGMDPAQVGRLYGRARRLLPRLEISNEVASWDGLAGIAVFSEFAAGFLRRDGVPESLIHVLPPGLDDPGPMERPDNDVFTFMFAGRDPKRKGVDLIIAATRRLIRLGLHVRTVLLGDPSYEELDGEPGFEVHGWVERDRLLREFYPRADAFLLPSRVEGFGLVVVEAMAFGVPVICSSQGAFPEILDHGRAGVLVPTGEAEALSIAMERWVREPNLARQIGSAGRARFETEYMTARMGERMGEFYARALAHG